MWRFWRRAGTLTLSDQRVRLQKLMAGMKPPRRRFEGDPTRHAKSILGIVRKRA